MTYGEDQRGPVTRPPLRVPHVLLHPAEVKAAVRETLNGPTFVFDLETDSQRTRTNRILWFGFGTPERSFLIPTDHPHGPVKVKAHVAETPAYTLYGPEDPRSYTSTGKPSFRKIRHAVEATYYPKPRQLFADQICEIIEPLLWSDREIIGHHLKFDLMTIAKYYDHRIPPGPYHDTIVLRHVLNENETSYGLKELIIDWFKPKDRKTYYPQIGKKGVGNFGLDEVASYLNKDLRYCWMMFKHWFARLLRNPELKAVYDFEMSLYPVLMDMEYAGFPVDTSGMETVRKVLEEEIAKTTQRCYELAGDTFEMSNTNVKRWVLFGSCKGKVKTAFGMDLRTGQSTKRPLVSQQLTPLSYTPEDELPQLTQAILEYYADRNEMAGLFLMWSGLEKLRGTFVEGLTNMLQNNGGPLPTLHTSFKQHGTKTGRLSSSEPNLQQLPRGSTIRDLFVAGPGYELIVADYDQIELRCAAQQSGDRNMLKVFRRGDDVHRQAAAAMYSVPLEVVTEEQRAVGKIQNFAVLYGAGEVRIASVARCSVRRARQLIARYYELFSDLEPWKNRVLKKARDDLEAYVVIPPLGRRRRLDDLFHYSRQEEWRRFRAERQAINAIVQGFASYITKMAMLDLHEVLQEFPARMVLQVHDEVIVQVDKRYTDVVLPVVSDVMSGVKGPDGNPILGEIPLIVSAKAGYTWSSAKGK